MRLVIAAWRPAITAGRDGFIMILFLSNKSLADCEVERREGERISTDLAGWPVHSLDEHVKPIGIIILIWHKIGIFGL